MSLKMYIFSLKMNIFTYQGPAKGRQFCSFVFCKIQNTAKCIENIALKLYQKFWDKIVSTQILIEYLITITECRALVDGLNAHSHKHIHTHTQNCKYPCPAVMNEKMLSYINQIKSAFEFNNDRLIEE
jgi:hypothetical protein